MAKRGRKALVAEEAIVHKDIQCQYCQGYIKNDGSIVYSLVTYWDVENRWLISKRVHVTCANNFIDTLNSKVILSASNVNGKTVYNVNGELKSIEYVNGETVVTLFEKE